MKVLYKDLPGNAEIAERFKSFLAKKVAHFTKINQVPVENGMDAILDLGLICPSDSR